MKHNKHNERVDACKHPANIMLKCTDVICCNVVYDCIRLYSYERRGCDLVSLSICAPFFGVDH